MRGSTVSGVKPMLPRLDWSPSPPSVVPLPSDDVAGLTREKLDVGPKERKDSWASAFPAAASLQADGKGGRNEDDGSTVE